MHFPQPLIPGSLIRRYKRFLVDVQLDDGTFVTAHCPNTGSMKGCYSESDLVWLSKSENENRKYPHTWELVKHHGMLIGINTAIPNKLIKKAIQDGSIPELMGYDRIQSEKKWGTHSRLDLYLEIEQEQCYIEIKNVTLVEQDIIYFPDAVTKRGAKHLENLMEIKNAGQRAVIFFLVQRPDGSVFQPARHIDPVYADLLSQAVNTGVEVLCYRAFVSLKEITLTERLPVELN